MNKYVNVEVAKEYLRHDSFDNPYFRSQACQQAMDVLDTVPAADVVEIVRCRKCIYHEYDTEINAYVCTGPMAYSTTPDDWYCASGIYKDGGKNE